MMYMETTARDGRKKKDMYGIMCNISNNEIHFCYRFTRDWGVLCARLRSVLKDSLYLHITNTSSGTRICGTATCDASSSRISSVARISFSEGVSLSFVPPRHRFILMSTLPSPLVKSPSSLIGFSNVCGCRSNDFLRGELFHYE